MKYMLSDDMLDLLSDILLHLSVKGTLYFRTSFSPPWGVEIPAYENVARFHFAHRGDCLVKVEGHDEVLTLRQGDIVLIPHGAKHRLYCTISTESDIHPLDQVISESGYTGEGVLVHGGPMIELETQLICGHFSFEPGSQHMILDRLPPYIHIENYGEASGNWLDATLRVIGTEAGGLKMGGDLIALKMSEVIFTQMLRSFFESGEASHVGLSGFADAKLARALTAFHQEPAKEWSVEKLARVAGLSRTGFALRFSEKMGITPMQYLTSWRMQIARKSLIADQITVVEAAALSGYASESAFSRAFKKEVGQSPAAYRLAG